MIKILLFMAVVCLSPPARSMEISPYFRDADSFTLARAIKLGTATEDSRLPGGKTPYVVEQKEKYECTSDAECSKKTAGYVCRSNNCVDPCAGVTCAAGKKCSAGSRGACAAGATDCKCSSPAVANGSGGCIDACSPNNCASTTPTCTRTGNGTTYSCACTSSSCGEGKQCSGGSCSNCAVNTQCTCPSGKVANGSGSCVSPTCSSNSDCGAGKQCSNAGTISASCTNCTANSQCTCPSGQVANGSGSCVKPVCYDNTPCGAGRQCIDPGKYNAKCDPCPSGTQCTCPSGQVADGSGGCGVAGCAGALAAARPDVAVAENASQLTTALASGKDTIAVTESFSTANAISLGSKKLVGPKYFAYVEGCSTASTPTLTLTSTSDAITMSGGSINNLALNHTVDSTSASTVVGSGTVQDMTFKAQKVGSMLKASGTLTLAGTNAFNSTDKSSYMINAPTSSDTVNINGPVTFDGNYSYGASVNGGKMTVASSGSITSNVEGHAGVNVDNGATFTANGPLKFNKRHTYTIYALTTKNVSIALNAAGNVLTSYFSGIYCTGGSVTIGGSTTIAFQANPNSSDGSSKTAIDMHEVYSSSVNSLTINAPVTITGLTKIHDSQYPTIYGDEILSMVGGTLKLTSTIESKSNVGKLLINGNSMNMSSSSAILGATYIYGDGKNFTAAAGAKLKLGGVCRKAASSGTLSSVTYDKAITSPVSPFTSGC